MISRMNLSRRAWAIAWLLVLVYAELYVDETGDKTLFLLGAIGMMIVVRFPNHAEEQHD